MSSCVCIHVFVFMCTCICACVLLLLLTYLCSTCVCVYVCLLSLSLSLSRFLSRSRAHVLALSRPLSASALSPSLWQREGEMQACFAGSPPLFSGGPSAFRSICKSAYAYICMFVLYSSVFFSIVHTTIYHLTSTYFYTCIFVLYSSLSLSIAHTHFRIFSILPD